MRNELNNKLCFLSLYEDVMSSEEYEFVSIFSSFSSKEYLKRNDTFPSYCLAEKVTKKMLNEKLDSLWMLYKKTEIREAKIIANIEIIDDECISIWGYGESFIAGLDKFIRELDSLKEKTIISELRLINPIDLTLKGSLDLHLLGR